MDATENTAAAGAATGTRPWRLRERHPAALGLAAEFRLPRVVGQVLAGLGLTTRATAARFLDPGADHLRRVEELPGAVAAGDWLWRACAGGRPVCVYGDYDVDGTCGAAILLRTARFLAGVAGRPQPHTLAVIPDRLTDGYGLGGRLVEGVIAAGYRDLIAVDCGITAHAACARLKAAGVSVAIADHHEFSVIPGFGGTDLPWADAIAHPRRQPDPGAPPTGCPDLCGSAVAWKVATAALQAAHRDGHFRGQAQLGGVRDFLRSLRALAAVATVADVVPLVGENRDLVAAGLADLADPGGDPVLAALAGLAADSGGRGRKAGWRPRAEDIAFRVAPRINAAGRLGRSAEGLRLLTAATADEAATQAALLGDFNTLRKAIEAEVSAEAAVQAAAQVRGGAAAVVVASPRWHGGVVGIAAARLAESLGVPALVAAVAGGVGHGSARSPVAWLHLADALNACRAHLRSCGGHAGAAGFSVDATALTDFRLAFCQVAAAARAAAGPTAAGPAVHCEAALCLADADAHLYDGLQALEPFGQGNPRPVFYFPACRVVEAATMGAAGNHLTLKLSQGEDGRPVRAVGFGQGQLAPGLRGFVDVAATLAANDWRGRREIELMVVAVRPSRPGTAPAERWN